MATKYNIITELYTETLDSFNRDTDLWLSFLDCASMNYKYPFQDQVLIYAQKPTARACADIETWNRTLKRWVNKGAKGIALLTEENGYPHLKYVFDVADTNSRYNNQIKLWSVNPRYEPDIIEAMENKYGELENKENLSQALISVANIMVDDNLEEYLTEINYVDRMQGLSIEDKKINEALRNFVKISVSYMLLRRSGYEPTNYLNMEDFRDLLYFNNPQALSMIGYATSDIAKMGLKDIYETLKNVRISELKKIRTFDNENNNVYDKSVSTNNRERSDLDDNLQNTRGLSDSRLNSSRNEPYTGDREIWTNEIGLSQKEQENSLFNTTNEQSINEPLDRDRQHSNNESTTSDRGNEEEREYNRTIETNQSNGMGRENEQLEDDGRGISDTRTNNELGIYEKSEDHHSFYVVTDHKINLILANTPHLKVDNRHIVDYFKNEEDINKRAEYLKSVFNNDYTGVMINDTMYGYKPFDNGVLFWKDNFLTRDTESLVSWEDLTYHYSSMILLNQLRTIEKPLKSVNEQMSLIDSMEIPLNDIEISQEFLDRYLQEENLNFRYRIYEEFSKNLATKDNIEFLKDYYGIGGSSYTIKGSGIGESHDSKGITFNRGYLDSTTRKQLFTWSQIVKRIKELIKVDRFLSSKELDNYPSWLEKEIQEREYREQHPYSFLEENKIEYEEPEYEYHLGDKVYIGIDEYEILEFDDEIVRCYDYQYPLFNKEFTREEFDRKVKENPGNRHLIKSKEETITTEKVEEIEEDVSQEIQEENDDIQEEIIVEEAVEDIVPEFEKKQVRKTTTFDIHPEIKHSDRSQFVIQDDNLGVGTPKEKYQRNINAIKTLKKCEEENRFATPEEQKILSEYVGWGGLSQAFDENNIQWSNEYKELKSLLTEKEYKNAMESTLTAFYTPPIVIRSMYKALENMGFKNGNILEPSCGVGNFLGMIPDSLKTSNLYGVELDSISGRIARQLYQKSSIAVEGFEKTEIPDSFFDVAIGNVPFGDFKLNDKRYDKNNFLIHDYFFAKTLDKVRPGGIVAFITSKGTMDKENPSVRKYIAQRADLLGAIRLPNTTFKSNAGTEVTADIIFLQKRDGITDIVPDWVYLDRDENGITMNNYFIENPDMIMGNMEMVSTRFGYDSACKLEDNDNLEDMLNNAITNIHAEINEYDIEEVDEEDLSIPADVSVRNFSYTIVENKIYFRENSRMYPQELAVTTENRVKSMIELRDCVRNLIDLQTNDYPDEDIKKEQVRLNDLYDKFNKKYGLINSRANSIAFSNDSSYFLLCSLEILNENGELARKADMFTKRTIRPHIEITKVDNSNEALIISISEKAKVDMDFIMELTGKSEDEIVKDLEGDIFLIPTNSTEKVYVTQDEYLSGNVRQKLRDAEYHNSINPIYESNIRYLKQAQPKDLSASEISIRLGATWIPESDIKDFIKYLLEPSYYNSERIKVHYSDVNGEWNIENKSIDKWNVKAHTTYGTSRANAYRIIEDSLNLRDVKIFDYEYDENGKRTQILNKKETAIAQGKQEQIKIKFNEWIWSDPDRRERLTKRYNEMYNSIKNRDYDGSHISFGGMNPEIKLRTHQVNAIARILYGGNTLLAHEVGAGKTFEMVAAAMESKRLGLCNKSLFVVPNHIIEQFASEFLQLYPSANILVSTKKDFETANRKKFCSRIATGDYDAIIIGHSQFEKIPMSVERQIKILNQQLDDITRGIKELKANGGENFSVKALMRSQKSIQSKLDKLNSQERKDDVITFEELGVDRLFVDEAHYYKNLYLYTKMRNVGGIAQTEAQKSSDLFMKCRYLDELTGNKGVIFATGTPISNSMVELYTMQRYLQYEKLLDNKLQHFDSWASTFGETITAIELAPEGTGYRSKTRFAKFYNLPELMSLFKEVADIQTADTLNLPVPKANYNNIVIKPSEVQLELVESFGERAELVRNKQVPSNEDNMLKITNDGRKLALDQRLINDMLEDYETSKVSVCADNVYKIWEENKDKKLTQLVFCDLSTPHNDGKFNVYDDIRNKLIEHGIPEEEIEFIHNANTEVKKKELFAKVRKGQVRILMGSTQKMGAGTNCQDKLIALHDLDCPWRPSDLTQRSGRIIRQGNQNSEVFIYRYVTEKTFDAYLYQLVENKQKFIAQIMTSKTPLRTAEDIDEVALSYAEIKALAAGNPLIIEKTDLDAQVSKLQLLKQSHLSEVYALEDKVRKTYPNQIKMLENRIDGYEKDIEFRDNNKTEIFEMIIGTEKYFERAEAGTKILEECKKMKNPEPIEIGEYNGFKMELSFDSMSRAFKINLKNNLTHFVELGSSNTGNITRIENVISGLEDKLEQKKTELTNVKVQFENAKSEMNRPFPHEEELQEKSKRLNELNVLLNLNEKTNEIVDDEKEEDNRNNFQSKEDYER